MIRLRVNDLEYQIKKPVEGSLLDFLLDQNIKLENPCNGKGTCGKCRVKVIGSQPELTETERSRLSASDRAAGFRLACFLPLDSDLTVELPQGRGGAEILSKGVTRDFQRDHFECGYGIALDIGTTTMVSELLDLTTGQILTGAAMLNPQKQYGLDVLTRITYEMETGRAGSEHLQRAVVDGINQLIADMTIKAGVEASEIKEICVGANTTMAHFLLGIDATPMGRFPYSPAYSGAQRCLAKTIGIHAGDRTELYILPHVSAFIGADVLAGVYVSNLKAIPGTVLFIDIGTNGEMVLKSQNRLICCSCAAGPALEGMNISAGMRAEAGAVEDIKLSPRGLELTTINDESPRGLCGSGILAAVRELLKNQMIKPQGAFLKKEELDPLDYRQGLIGLNGTRREFIVNRDPRIVVSQGDIRQVQLAKGAILSGFTALLERLGLESEELDKVLIAGQFGAHLPVDSLISTGILPATVRQKIVYVGNTSKTGAAMALMSGEVKREMAQLSREMEYIELGTTENYEKIFREALMFPISSEGGKYA